MKLAQIDRLPIRERYDQDTKQLRRQAPRYIKSIIEDTRALPQVDSIEEFRPSHFSPLAGSHNTVTYLVRSPKTAVIIKMSRKGLKAESEAIEAWRQRRVSSPDIIQTGIVPATQRRRRPVEYLVQEVLLDRDDQLAPTASSYLKKHPEQAGSTGYQMGRQLNRAHQSVSDRSFGEFLDARGNTAPYRSWNSYLLGFLATQEQYCLDIGITKPQLSAIRRSIKSARFAGRGRYLHGDFGARNTIVTSYQPLRIALIDPNPLIGDPMWDLAPLSNNAEFQRRLDDMGAGAPEGTYHEDLAAGFRRGYTRKIYPLSLYIVQLIQALLQSHFMEDKLAAGKATSAQVIIRQETVSDLVKLVMDREDG